jgi:predicted TIM-barrel fold metal-dependent hydrolase
MSEIRQKSDRVNINISPSKGEHDLSRREVLGLMGGGFGAAILGTGLFESPATMAQDNSLHVIRQTDGDLPRRIDTHQHIVPAKYAEWLKKRGVTAGGYATPAWSAEAAIDFMDGAGIETSILSISTPGVDCGSKAKARSWAREMNEYAAEIVSNFPGRFGFFAVLTLPDVKGSIAEASYALDMLKADGVVLYSNVRGRYLGDPAWDPLMEELNARKTILFEHPSQPRGPGVPGIPAFVADFLNDTVRSAINLAKNGCVERYPDLKIILSHGGGYVPYAAERLAYACSKDGSIESGVRRLRQFYYDTALSSTSFSLPSLLTFADPTRITFGSDFPYASKKNATSMSAQLDAYGMSEAQRRLINRVNAEAIFPRFALQQS